MWIVGFVIPEQEFQLILLCTISIKKGFSKCLAHSCMYPTLKYISKRSELPFWLGVVEKRIYHYIFKSLITGGVLYRLPADFIQGAGLPTWLTHLAPGLQGTFRFSASSGPAPTCPYAKWVVTWCTGMFTGAFTHWEGQQEPKYSNSASGDCELCNVPHETPMWRALQISLDFVGFQYLWSIQQQWAGGEASKQVVRHDYKFIKSSWLCHTLLGPLPGPWKSMQTRGMKFAQFRSLLQCTWVTAKLLKFKVKRWLYSFLFLPHPPLFCF